MSPSTVPMLLRSPRNLAALVIAAVGLCMVPASAGAAALQIKLSSTKNTGRPVAVTVYGITSEPTGFVWLFVERDGTNCAANAETQKDRNAQLLLSQEVRDRFSHERTFTPKADAGYQFCGYIYEQPDNPSGLANAELRPELTEAKAVFHTRQLIKSRLFLNQLSVSAVKPSAWQIKCAYSLKNKFKCSFNGAIGDGGWKGSGAIFYKKADSKLFFYDFKVRWTQEYCEGECKTKLHEWDSSLPKREPPEPKSNR